MFVTQTCASYGCTFMLIYIAAIHWMQDVWSEQENEDLDRAIALSLAEQDQKGKRVIGKLFFPL